MSRAALSEDPSPLQSSPSLESSPCLQGERVTFTGTLASMTHAGAAKLVSEHGGTSTDHVSRQTTMLVVGEEGWPLEDDGQPSMKLCQAERWQQSGCELRVLNESEWLALLGLTSHREEVHRLYTPAMLSSILGISVHMIRSWARIGLIRPVRKVYRLPYFDFREVSSARRLSDLLNAGVSRKDLEESIQRLSSVRSGMDRPLEQLQILAHRVGVVVRDDHGLVMAATGQRLLDFDGSPTEPDVDPESESELEPVSLIRMSPQALGSAEPRDWLIEGCRLYDSGNVPDALEAFRMAAMTSPNSADVHFQLGECLYGLGKVEAALERHYAAVEHDHDFLEAWTQIGCLHRELMDLDAARMAFLVALDILPDYADAHFHLAETLHELEDFATAQGHWEEYLKHDSRGPWADLARQRLEHFPENRM